MSVYFEPSEAPHITARERHEIDRLVRAQRRAREAGVTYLLDALAANA